MTSVTRTKSILRHTASLSSRYLCLARCIGTVRDFSVRRNIQLHTADSMKPSILLLCFSILILRSNTVAGALLAGGLALNTLAGVIGGKPLDQAVIGGLDQTAASAGLPLNLAAVATPPTTAQPIAAAAAPIPPPVAAPIAAAPAAAAPVPEPVAAPITAVQQPSAVVQQPITTVPPAIITAPPPIAAPVPQANAVVQQPIAAAVQQPNPDAFLSAAAGVEAGQPQGAQPPATTVIHVNPQVPQQQGEFNGQNAPMPNANPPTPGQFSNVNSQFNGLNTP
eukprot:439502_1